MESLQSMSVEQLQEIEGNEERMDQLALESPELQNLQLEKNRLMVANRELAEENLSFQPRLDNGRILLQEKYESLEEATAHYRQQKIKLDSFASSLDPKTMLPTLRDHLRAIEEESEEMAEKFLEGLIPLETFLEDFASKRRLSHQRRVRVEKLQELLKMQETRPHPNVQPSERQTQPSIRPSPAPPIVDPRATVPGLPDRRPSSPFALPYAPSPPPTDQPMPMGPVAHGNLAPSVFPGFQGPQGIQQGFQRTFNPYDHPSAAPNSHLDGPRYSYSPSGSPSHTVGYPVSGFTQPYGPGYPVPRTGGQGYPFPQGPGYPQPGVPAHGYPHYPPGGPPRHPASQSPYPVQRPPGPPQPPYPPYPGTSAGFPQPSFPGGSAWPR